MNRLVAGRASATAALFVAMLAWEGSGLNEGFGHGALLFHRSLVEMCRERHRSFSDVVNVRTVEKLSS
jgi:hypothetical protein